MSTPAELWSKLTATGLAAGDMPALEEAHTPWYVRVMLGVAGIIAAVFLLAFIGVGVHSLIENEVGSVATGLALIGAAYGLFSRGARSEFGSMFALSVSVAGQVLLAFGVFRMFGGHRDGIAAYVIIGLIEATLAFVIPNFIHRLGTAYAAAIVLSYAFYRSGAWYLPPGLVAAGVAAVWVNEIRFARRHSTAAPIGYGLTLAYIQIATMKLVYTWIGVDLRPRSLVQMSPWMGEALVIVAFVASVWVLLRRAEWKASEPRALLALAAAVAIGIVSFKAPGIAGGLMIILLGFANGNRVLSGLGIAALLFYVSAYYYQMHETLLYKSGVLLVTGAVLLAARWVVLNVIMKETPDA